MHPLKERIINQAVRSFSERGFRKVTLDEISADLGVSKKTLYKFFRSKEELIKAVIHLLEQRMQERDRAIMNDCIPWEEKIFKIVFAPQGLRCPGNVLLEELIHYYPEDFERLSRIKVDLVRELLAEAISKGSIRPEIDPRLVIMIFMNMLEHLVIEEAFLYENKLNLADTLEMVGDIILNGIKVKG